MIAINTVVVVTVVAVVVVVVIVVTKKLLLLLLLRLWLLLLVFVTAGARVKAVVPAVVSGVINGDHAYSTILTLLDLNLVLGLGSSMFFGLHHRMFDGRRNLRGFNIAAEPLA